MPAASYYELMGLGSHSANPAWEGGYLCDEDAANTAVVDWSGNSNDAALQGGNNTEDLFDADTPTGWLNGSFDNGGNDSVLLPDSVMDDVDDEATFLIRLKNASTGNQGAWYLSTLPTANNDHYPHSGKIWLSTFRAGRVDNITSGVTLTEWHTVAITSTPGAGGWLFYQNGSVVKTTSGYDPIRWTSGALKIGESGNPQWNYGGKYCDVNLFSAVLADTEIAEWAAGPEPVNTVAPAISGTETEDETLSVTSGTWALASPFSAGTNGTITYGYQWTRSDDDSGTNEADISGATSNTYTLQAADVGSFIRCRVRATNDGGYDAAEDTNSDMSGEIAAAGGGGVEAEVIQTFPSLTQTVVAEVTNTALVSQIFPSLTQEVNVGITNPALVAQVFPSLTQEVNTEVFNTAAIVQVFPSLTQDISADVIVDVVVEQVFPSLTQGSVVDIAVEAEISQVFPNLAQSVLAGGSLLAGVVQVFPSLTQSILADVTIGCTVVQTFPSLTQSAVCDIQFHCQISQTFPSLTQGITCEVSVDCQVSQIFPSLSQECLVDVTLESLIVQVFPSLTQTVLVSGTTELCTVSISDRAVNSAIMNNVALNLATIDDVAVTQAAMSFLPVL